MSSADNEETNLKENLSKFFKNFYQTKENAKFEIDKIEMSPGCPKGENFVAEVIQLVITGHYLHCGEKSSTLTENIIIKRIPPSNSIQHALYNITKMFQNEITFYENILPLLQSHGVNVFPEYYGRRDGFIALEDLTIKGYKMADRIQGLNFQECKMVLRELAHFHAASFALKKAEDKIFQNGLNNLQEVVFSPEHFDNIIEIIWENSLQFATKSLEFSDDPKLKRATLNIKKYSGTVFNHLLAITKPSGKFDVICHGDLWSNNIMIKYNEKDTLINVKLLDLQAARHSSCVLDVMHLIFTSATPEIVKRHLYQLLEIYFEYLESKMKTLGVLPVFAFHDLTQEFREKISYGLLVSFLMFTCITNKTNEVVNFSLDKNELSSEKMILEMYAGLSPEYHARLHSLVLALQDLGFLEE